MVVILHIGTAEVPLYRVHDRLVVDEGNSDGTQRVRQGEDEGEGDTYCDRNRKIFVLQDCRCFARCRSGLRVGMAEEIGEPEWSECALDEAVMAVMSEFGEELRALGFIVEEEKEKEEP